MTASLWGATIYTQANLTSDIPGLAANTDPNLKNPWGVSFSATSPFWISDQATNVSTLYDGLGALNPLVVSTPPTSGAPLGPTGQVFNNSGGGFALPTGSPALFIFATLAGTIDAWNGASGTTATIVATSANSVYTGLAIGSNSTGSFLYAANFAGGRIDVFNSTYAPTTLGGTFVDPNLPAGYVPYNIENIGGTLYVAYSQVNPVTHEAAVGAGLGVVSLFDTNGNFIRRLVSSGGQLNAPWGVTVTPAAFGDFSSKVLVGNFGDGSINAFEPSTGAFLGTLQDANGNPIVNNSLWALKVRSGGPNVNPNAVYFTAGINDEVNGLFGSIQAAEAIPEPRSISLIVCGIVGLLVYGRSARRTV
jgi:uncharacterized protein (TIGR03118 family)